MDEVESSITSNIGRTAAETLLAAPESANPDAPIRGQLVLKNFLALATGNAAEHIIKLFSSIYVRRVLGLTAIGQLSWSASVVSYFTLLTNPGFQSIAKRQVARDPQQAGHYVMLLTLLQAALATLAFGLAVVFSLVVPRSAEVRLLIVLQALSLFVVPLDLSWLLQARERMLPLSVASMLSNVFQALFLVLLVHEPSHVVRYVLLAYPFRLGFSAFMLQYCRRQGLLRMRSLRPTLEGGWTLLVGALPIALSQSAILLYYNSDAIFLGFTHGDQVVGLYSTAYSVMLLPNILAQALVNAYFPVLSRVHASFEDARRVSGEFLKAMVWLGFPMAFLGWAVGRYVVVLLFGQAFAPAGLLFEWLSLNTALIFFNWGQLEPLVAWDAQKLAFKCTLAGAISNMAANVVLIPRYGPWGAVATTILAELVVMVWAIWARRELPPLGWNRSLLIGIAICVPAALLARWITVQSGLWYIGLAIGVVGCGVGAMLFERQNILGVYNHVRRALGG
jgi:O-antigen/teichoic acid export membrane protein